MRNLILSILFLLVTTTVFAQTQTPPFADDRDLSGSTHFDRTKSKNLSINTLIKPDRIEEGAMQAGLHLQFVRMVKGVETPIEGLTFKKLKTNEQGMLANDDCKDANFAVSISLEAARYSVVQKNDVYSLNFAAKCGVMQKIIFDEQSDAGQVLAIWQIATHAEKKLSQEVDIKFWKTKIQFNFPGQGDYYSFDEVNITKGYQWDVVSHELGHAIYDQAKIGVFGGGEHKIDQCYSDALAISEGWASFFAAWLNLDLNDADAKFEYMVPRRAPIRIENVPTDVCGKITSEWRVFSFFWDLVDLHDDGELISESFSRLWGDTLSLRAHSMNDFKSKLISRGWDTTKLDLVWKLNFPAEE